MAAISQTTISNAFSWMKIYMNFNEHIEAETNARHFPDDIFQCIFLNENVWISINISLNFVLRGQINNIPEKKLCPEVQLFMQSVMRRRTMLIMYCQNVYECMNDVK